MSAYLVNDVFGTLQGEGYLAGTPAVFIRFAGCNLWSGRPEHRVRDAVRNGASCPRWCDTDFITGDVLDADEVAEAAKAAAKHAGLLSVPLVVFTGGEPLLQLDAGLIGTVRLRLTGDPKIAIETNGTVALSESLAACIDWVCVSPKVDPEAVLLRSADELKVVYPGGHEPEDYARDLGEFQAYTVSALAETDATTAGESAPSLANMRAAARYCIAYPRWRLSIQTHKFIGLP